MPGGARPRPALRDKAGPIRGSPYTRNCESRVNNPHYLPWTGRGLLSAWQEPVKVVGGVECAAGRIGQRYRMTVHPQLCPDHHDASIASNRRTIPMHSHDLVSRFIELIRSCRVPRVRVGQSRWRPVMMAAGEPAPREGIGAAQCVGHPVLAAMRRTRSAASGAGIPAAVTNSERPEDPPPTGHRVGSRAEPGLGHPDHPDAELGVRGPSFILTRHGVRVDDQTRLVRRPAAS